MIPLDAKVYEVLSLAMRYFFTLFGVMIVWRAFSWLRKDRKQKHRRLKQLPDAGTIGILTVECGSKQLKEGEAIPVPHEGVLGYLRTCDVVVPVDDVATMHLDFTFVDGKGLYIHPRRGCEAMVDGMPITSRRDSQRCPMQHGSVLKVGQAVLRLGVFAGLDVKEAIPAAFTTADYATGSTYIPDMPESFVPPQPWPGPNQPWPQQSAYPQNPPYQPGPYVQPPYAPPVNSPVQPSFGQSPYAPPYQQPDPWQGGDDDAQ